MLRLIPQKWRGLIFFRLVSMMFPIRAYSCYRLVARICRLSEGPATNIRPRQFGEFSDVVCDG